MSPGTKSHNRLMDRIAGRLRFFTGRKINIEGLEVTGDTVLNVNMDLIVQSVNTLLDNAAKYTSEGSEIYLGVQQGDGAEGQGEAKAMTGAVKVQPGYAVIYVRDTGPGIPDEERREIFKAFTGAYPPGEKAGPD